VRRTQLAVRARLDASLEPTGLTTPQYGVLSLLAWQGEQSASDLARELGVTAQTMNVLVTALAGRGLVARRAHPGHGRILLVELTDAGRGALGRGLGVAQALEDRLLAGVSDADRARLIEQLRAIEAAARG
jgi:DNA-binding MarR family transcriptional regulator